jgi:ubiquinone/menaquinone biosynthesis C-methylase UbiE
MTTNSNTEWKMWGKADPLAGVAAWKDKNKGGGSPWTDREFYDLGRADWADFVAHWEKYGVDKRACLEIGCGAGRMTAPLSEYFDAVHAIDVSEEMIAHARNHIVRQNVSFHVVDGSTIPLSDASVNAAFSTHVFQHLDSEDDATCYFQEIFRVLGNGGSLMIHLPLLAWPVNAPTWTKVPYRFRQYFVKKVRNMKRRSILKGRFVPVMVMRSYTLDYLYGILDKLGFQEIEIVVFRTRSNRDPHPFVMARKGS